MVLYYAAVSYNIVCSVGCWGEGLQCMQCMFTVSTFTSVMFNLIANTHNPVKPVTVYIATCHTGKGTDYQTLSTLTGKGVLCTITPTFIITTLM